MLRSEGASIDLLCLGTVCPLDESLIMESARRTRRVVTIEEHYVRGGLGGSVCELLSEHPGVAVHRIGVRHDYVTTGTYEEVRASLGLDVAGITRQVRSVLEAAAAG